MVNEWKSLNAVYEDMLFNMDSYIYVSDFMTDKLLYVNQKVIEQSKIFGDYSQIRCWEILMGETKRCSFCPKLKCDPNNLDQVLEWETRRPEDGAHLQHRGRLIKWSDGRLALFQQTMDITNYRLTERQAKTRLHRQELMSVISKSFISSEDINVSIDNALQMTAEFMNYDKMLLAVSSDDCTRLDITSEFCGINMNGEKSEWVSKQLAKGDIIHDAFVAGKEPYLELHGKQCEYFSSYYMLGLQTSLIFPIKFNGDFLGVIKFDMLDVHYKWEEEDIQLAELVASVFSGVINRIRMSRSLELTKQRLEIAVKSSGIGIWDIDMKEQTITFNEEFANIHRVPADILSPISLEKWFAYSSQIEYEEEKICLEDFVESCTGKKLIDTLDIPYQFSDGSMVFTRVSSTPVWDEDGKLDHIIGMTWDITMDVEQNRELSEIQSRLSIALDASQAGIWEISLKDDTISFDEVVARLFKFDSPSPMPLAECTDYLLTCIAPDHVEYKETVRKHFKELRDVSAKTHKFIFADKETRYISSTVRVLRDGQGRPRRLIGMLMDVTELRLAELDVEERLKQQELMSDIAQCFVKIEDMNGAFIDALSMVAKFLKVDASYIYRYDAENDSYEWVHSWIASNVKLNHLNVDRLAGDFVREYVIQNKYSITEAEGILIPKGAMQQDYKEEMQFYHLNIPLYIKNKLWGFVGVSNIEKTRNWTESDKDMLYLFSSLIDSAMGREIAEENLKKSERTLQTVIDVLHHSIFWKDAETGVFEGCNDAYLKLIEKTRDQVIGKTNMDIFEPDIANLKEQKDQIATKMEEPYFYFEEHQKEGGITRTVKVAKSVVRDSKGNPIRLVGTAEDITESCEMEMQIREALENQELALRNFNGVFVSIGNDRIVKLFGGISMFGIDGENAVGRNIHDVYKEAPVIQKAVEKAFAKGTYEFIYQHQSKISQCQLTPVLSPEGEQIGLLFVGRDMTEQYAMQKKLEKAIIAAEDASRAKTDFLARMSHEIRTPMNAIIGMTKIGMDAGEEERKQYCLKQIDVASENLLEIINQILDMSKIEANKLELERVEFDLKKLLDNICLVMGIRVNEKCQKLEVIYENEILTNFIGDETRLSQILTNLLSNAVKFTPENGRIEIRAREMENKGKYAMLKISVKDNGIGVAKEQQERIFHSFEQADGGTSRKFGGTGLGLAICKKLVEMMHGDIWLNSKQGEGATFTFTVRLGKGKPIAEEKVVEERVEKSEVLQGKQILLVEDGEINREIVVTLLAELDINVDTAVNGKQAVEMFEKEPDRYDLILMDVQMPEMDGYEATRSIRKLPYEYAKKIGIVAMTANVFREDVERCLAAGMNDHISKPINFMDMQEKMAKHIR